MRALVAAHHGLGDLRLQGQHALQLLRGDVVALVVDDDVLLAVGDDDPATLVDVADVAGAQPVVRQRCLCRFRVFPVTLHDQLAAHEDFPVLGDLDLDPHQRRADGVQGDSRAGVVAGGDRRGLRLAIALQHDEAHGLEEAADFRVERRAAGNERLHPATEARLDLGPERGVEQQAYGHVLERTFAGNLPLAQPDRPFKEELRHGTLLLDVLDDLFAQDLEQARDHDHEGGLRFLQVAGKLVEPFGKPDVCAEANRQVEARSVFQRVA